MESTEVSISEVLGTLKPPELVRQQAFEHIRGAIMNGALPPGKRLVERELCEALGVSRTSIRETLRRLEAERLIEVEPYKGPVVSKLSLDEALQIYEIRRFLEGQVAERFVERAADEDIQALRGMFEEFEYSAQHSDVAESVAIKVRFYDLLKRVANANIYDDLLSQLTARVSALRAKSMSVEGRISESVEEIRVLVEAIESRDSKAAAAAAQRHVTEAAKAATIAIADAEGARSAAK